MANVLSTWRALPVIDQKERVSADLGAYGSVKKILLANVCWQGGRLVTPSADIILRRLNISYYRHYKYVKSLFSEVKQQFCEGENNWCSVFSVNSYRSVYWVCIKGGVALRLRPRGRMLRISGAPEPDCWTRSRGPAPQAREAGDSPHSGGKTGGAGGKCSTLQPAHEVSGFEFFLHEN